jgi:hypothetical protein
MPRVHWTRLTFVYPPISNQEAEWVREVEDVQALMRHSDFYAIAARAELFFTDVELRSDGLAVSIQMDDGFEGHAVLSALVPPGMDFYDGDINIEIGPKIIRYLRDPEDGTEEDVLQWFTADKLLRDRSHGMTGIRGLDNYADAMTYDLLYIGIAKVGDSYDRVIQQAHTARARILSNELQRGLGARVADEVYIFLFDEGNWNAGELGTDDLELPAGYSEKRVVADAEKAFVSYLQPPYNEVLFKNYPKGADGLYGLGFDAYGYFIGESLTFKTATATIRGGEPSQGGVVGADVILIIGDEVSVGPIPNPIDE